jgi:tetratricopeptide (TPR) repeat protein
MTQPETPEPIPRSEPARGATAEAAEAPQPEEPKPEPWTAERVSEWNAYYDVYVVLGVLLLTFLASANKITHSSLWNQLQIGREIAAKSAPVLQDTLSYTQEGSTWVNIPWLFEWGHAVVHKAAYDLTPINPGEPIASAAKADQVAAGTLVALDALARLLTAMVLLCVRRSGPGRWWSAVCVVLALGAMLSPAGVILGGIAGPAQVAPATWGLLLLALEVWLLFRAIDLGRPGSAFLLVPLFALWANVDESFLIGLMVLAATAVGRVRPAPGEPTGALRLPTALGVLAASALACLANPSFAAVYRAAADPFLGLFRPATDVVTPDQLSYFGPNIRLSTQEGSSWLWLVGYYLVVVGIGFGSFYLNRRRFSLSRFLAYTVAVVLWGIFVRLDDEFAVVFAATLALNGQEWYQRRFGTAGRLGAGWSLWSVGGRAVTITLIFLCVAKTLLGGLPVPGLRATEGDSRFGFGYDPDDFAFEAADFLKTAPVRGNVLNTTKALGDALIWRAPHERKTYIDSRQHLFPAEVLNRLQETRKALSEDDLKAWMPLFDQYKISTLLIQPSSSRKTYQVLSMSENWIPFYDDGAVVMFGRADAPEADLAFFKANRLDPELRAYKVSKPTPPAERPPLPVTWIDNFFQTRALARPQPHNEAAAHWLSGQNIGNDSDQGQLRPDPARCLLAIREARTALASKPDDTQAYRILAVAYRELAVQETALMAGIELTPENAPRLGQIQPRPNVLPTRFRQIVTALNYAIQTTPPPRTREARAELIRLNVELFQLLLSANHIDLARDRLQAVLDNARPGDFNPQDANQDKSSRAQLAQDKAQLDERIRGVEEEMTRLSTEQQFGPVQLASFAMNQGAPGLAIHELEEAERTGTNPALVKPQLLDLYCETGQADKAVEMLVSGTIDDPSFGSEPGVSAMRQARVHFLLGNADYAGTIWEKYAIPRLRFERAIRSLDAAKGFIRGDVRPVTGSLLEIPGKIAQQANWEFEAGLCRLEGGTPELATEHFSKALELEPKLNTRPVIAYYLAKLGSPAPPLPTEPSTAPEKPAAEKEKGENAPPAAEPGKPEAKPEPAPEVGKSEEKPKGDAPR